MAAKMAVYYKNIRNFPSDRQTPGTCMRNADLIGSWVTDIILVTSQ